MASVPAQSEWLRVQSETRRVGVDRDAKIIRGYVLAQEGPFKTPGRGEFDLAGLKQIVKLAKSKPLGLKSRFAHPSLSGDGIGTFLGRAQNVQMGMVQVERNGERLELNAVRGDLHLDKTAFATPNGDLGTYVLDLAESDPEAMSSSLVLQPEERLRVDKKGKPELDDKGEPLPPLWWPVALHASDIVDTGDAVDGFLSATGLDDSLVREGFKLLSGFLPGQPRDVVEARLRSWLDRAMELRYGDEAEDDVIVLPAVPLTEVSSIKYVNDAVTAVDLERRLRQRTRVG